MASPEPIAADDAQLTPVAAPTLVVEPLGQDVATLVDVGISGPQLVTLAGPGSSLQAIGQSAPVATEIPRLVTTTTGISTAGPQGPRGLPGPPGAPGDGDCDYDDLPDLTLIFNNGVI